MAFVPTNPPCLVQIPGSDTLDESKAGFGCDGEGTLVDVWLPIEIAAAALAHGS